MVGSSLKVKLFLCNVMSPRARTSHAAREHQFNEHLPPQRALVRRFAVRETCQRNLCTDVSITPAIDCRSASMKKRREPLLSADPFLPNLSEDLRCNLRRSWEASAS